MRTKFAKIFFIVIYSTLIIFLFRKEISWFIAPEPEIKRYIREEFDDGKFTGLAQVELEGFTPGEKGLYLKGQSTGRLIYNFRKNPEEALTIYVRSYGDGAVRGVKNRWWISYEGGEFQPLSANIRRFNRRDFLIDLIKESQGKKDVTLQLEAVNENKVNNLVLNWLEIKFINPATIGGSIYRYPKAWRMSLFLILLLTPVLVISFKLKNFIFIWLIFLLGFHLRYQNLTEMIFTGLETDPIKHMQYAKQMKPFTSSNGFYSGKFGYRGPLFPFVSKAFHFILGGYTPTRQRLVSFTFSLLVILLTYILGKKFLKRGLSLLAASLVSISPVLIYESGRGNRLEFITCLVVLFLLCSYFLKIRFRNIFILGILAGLIALSGFYLMLPILIFAILLLIERKRQFQNFSFLKILGLWLTVISVAMLIFLPHYYRVSRKYGDITRKYARLNAELEYSGKQRLPFDKKIRITYQPEQKDFSYFDYMFKMHTFQDIVFYHLWGYTKALLLQGIPLDRSTYANFISAETLKDKVRYTGFSLLFAGVNIICIFGLFYCLLLPNIRLLPFFVILNLAPIAFILGWRAFEFQRYIMHIYPAYLVCGLLLFKDKKVLTE